MITVNIDIFINAPSERIFKFISNFENNPIWQKGMVSCKYTEKTENILGSKYDQLAKFMRKDIVTSFEVINYDPGRMIKATSTSGSFPITFTRIVESNGDGTSQVKAKIEGDSSGFFRIFSPIMKFMVNRSINRDYKKLKEHFENKSNSD